MKRIAIPNPPNPDDARFKTNPLAYSRAVYDWMQKTKQQIEGANVNVAPVQQPFAVTSYTTSTTLNGTQTGTDITNFLCSLVSALSTKGILRTSTAT